MINKTYNPYINAQAQFDKVADMLDLDQASRDLLRQPHAGVPYHYSLFRMDDGKSKSF